MKTSASGDKDIFLLVFFAGILSAFLLIWLISTLDSNERKKDEATTNQTIEITQLTDKVQRFSVNGYNIKTTTVCFEGNQMLFVFYRGEPQIVNLNKNCGEIK
nr:MAG TPA: hypothetical protein [Bacteriophage sp.]